MLEKIHKITVVDIFIILGIVLMIIGIGINLKDNFLTKEKTEIINNKNEGVGVTNDVQVNSKVTIDVAGEVINPGVYVLKNTDRVGDALVAAGGLGAKADRDWVDVNLNKAEKLYDGQKIYIPKIGKSSSSLSSSSSILGASKSIIRINSASLEELDKLDGVGPSIAQRIINYRTTNGGFKSVEEIKLVPGIGDKMFEKIKNEIQL